MDVNTLKIFTYSYSRLIRHFSYYRAMYKTKWGLSNKTCSSLTAIMVICGSDLPYGFQIHPVLLTGARYIQFSVFHLQKINLLFKKNNQFVLQANCVKSWTVQQWPQFYLFFNNTNILSTLSFWSLLSLYFMIFIFVNI